MKYIKDAFLSIERENNANLFEHDLKTLLNNLALRYSGGKQKYDELTYQDQLSARNLIEQTLNWNTKIDNSKNIDKIALGNRKWHHVPHLMQYTKLEIATLLFEIWEDEEYKSLKRMNYNLKRNRPLGENIYENDSTKRG